MSDYAKWFVRGRKRRLLWRTAALTREDALAKFLSGKRYPVWGPWYESGYRLVKIVATVAS